MQEGTGSSQIAYECFPFTAVPQTDLKHFNLESSLGSAWLNGKSTPTGLDASPELGSDGYSPQCPCQAGWLAARCIEQHRMRNEPLCT